MSWFYSKNGMQIGPVTAEELAAKAKSGEVLASDLVWQEGMSDWKPLGQVEDFQGIITQPPAIQRMGSVPIPQPMAYPAGYNPQIPNYLWQSIVATILCCMPFGVVAIVHAAKVDSLVAMGDIAGANVASKAAKTWVGVAVGVWIVGIVIYGIFVISVAVAGASGSHP